MTILDIINQIEADKKAKHIEPSHALFLEVVKEATKHYPVSVKEIVTAELEELVKQNKIRTGRTLNDNYITIL